MLLGCDFIVMAARVGDLDGGVIDVDRLFFAACQSGSRHLHAILPVNAIGTITVHACGPLFEGLLAVKAKRVHAYVGPTSEKFASCVHISSAGIDATFGAFDTTFHVVFFLCFSNRGRASSPPAFPIRIGHVQDVGIVCSV